MKRLMFASASAALAMGGSIALSAPATAAPLFTGGLVNVNVSNVLNNSEILSRNDVGLGVAAGIAANVCDVNVGGILGQLRDAGTATCTSDAGDQVVTITQ